MNFVSLLGFLAATLTTIAFLPQLFKVWQSKSAGDVSLTMLITFMTGVFFWLIYGVCIGSWPVIVANFLTFIFNGIILYLKLKYHQ